jgi:twitching motility two-component system response regulator PilH
MKIKVLVVDDDPGVRYLVRRVLEDRGMEVDEAESGEEALERLKETKPDLVLLDVMMPGMNGWEVLRRIKGDENLKSIPVAMLSAVDPSVDDMMRAEFDELVDYILKPEIGSGLLSKFKIKVQIPAGAED